MLSIFDVGKPMFPATRADLAAVVEPTALFCHRLSSSCDCAIPLFVPDFVLVGFVFVVCRVAQLPPVDQQTFDEKVANEASAAAPGKVQQFICEVCK
jgi:Tfp pilus assembly protein FimV